MATADAGRCMSPKKEIFWKEQRQKEDLMRLKWFTQNQKKLIESAEREITRKNISPEVLKEVERMMLKRYKNAKRKRKKNELSDIKFPDIDPNCIMNIMKPVDPKVAKLLYTNMEKLGRRNYLTKRYLKRPEDRYYYTECSSFVYGWQITDAQKKMDEPRYGLRQVIQDSFYRRNGALNNPPFFQREP